MKLPRPNPTGRKGRVGIGLLGVAVGMSAAGVAEFIHEGRITWAVAAMAIHVALSLATAWVIWYGPKGSN